VEENVLGGLSKMLDLSNGTDPEAAVVVNTTVNPDKSAVPIVFTTVKPDVVEPTYPPALDVEEEQLFANSTVPGTAVSVPDSVKEFTEAEFKTAKVTGEI
jgi:hypothetical protein